MTKNITMRHELKYICSQKQLDEIKLSLDNVLLPDPNQGEFGYNIKSLYFDTVGDRLFNETLSGVDNRYKFRIRVYNSSDQLIKLEKKISINNLKTKEDLTISRKQFINILDNKYEYGCKLMDEMNYLNKIELLKPKLIVEYDRYAYVSEVGNVRITLDRNIRYSENVYGLFDKNIPTIPILPINRHILEVKYDGVLPGYIAKLLNIYKLERSSFSKYALCRCTSLTNGRLEDLYEYWY